MFVISLDVATRCNYFSSIWGVVSMKILTDIIYIEEQTTTEFVDLRFPIWIGFAIFFFIMSMADDALTVFMNL